MTAAAGRRAPAVRAAPAALALAALLCAAGPVAGAIPTAEKIVSAVAERNRDSRRDRVLAFRAAIRRRDGELAAIGELLTDPAGRARLELRDREGTVERHLMRGARYAVSRNGRLVPPRPLLPPLPLLQAGSPGQLRAFLRELGGDPGEVMLGHTEAEDCYVLGGRDIPAHGAGGEHSERVSLWVELSSFDAVQIDAGGGVHYTIGRLVSHDGLRVPSWIDIELPGEGVRLELRDPRAVEPAPGDFDPAWLRASSP